MKTDRTNEANERKIGSGWHKICKMRNHPRGRKYSLRDHRPPISGRKANLALTVSY